MRTESISDVIRDLAGGTIFSVVFVKRSDGERREMVCRLGTASKVKGDEGQGPSYNASDKGLLPVWDMQKNGWRSIPLEGIEQIKIRGEVHTFKGA